MESKIYNQEGKEVGKIALPEAVFNVPWNADLVHQVVVSMQGNARSSVAHTHDRGEQRGGGRKPWKQKGTGRARHGSRRSPIWRGGGVTFGPRNEKIYGGKINKKMRIKALYTALSQKYRDGEVVFVDKISIPNVKTRDAKAIITSMALIDGLGGIAGKKKNAVLLALPEMDGVVTKSFRNMGNVASYEVRNINPMDVLLYKYLIITNPGEAITALQARSRSSAKESKLIQKLSDTEKVKKKSPVGSSKTVSRKTATPKTKVAIV